MIVTLALRVCQVRSFHHVQNFVCQNVVANNSQLIFSAVVLALSVVLVNGYGPGHAPSLLDYGVFCGAGALVIAAIGVIACFLEALQGIVILAIDGLASFFLLAGAAVCNQDDKLGMSY